MSAWLKISRGISKCLLIVCVLFTVLTGFFVAGNYPELLQFVRVTALIKNEALQPVSTAALLRGAIKGLVGSLNDPYSVYLEPEGYQSLQKNVTGSYGGVGLLISMKEDKNLVVISPIKGTPAHQAGIQSGDVIMRIDSQDVAGLDLETAANLMQGNPGTRVTLAILREGETNIREYTIKRDKIEIPTVEGRLLDGQPGIVYLNIAMFNSHTSKDMEQILTDLQPSGYTGIILDLRNNPGGDLEAAVEVAKYFIPEGPVVHIVDRYHTGSYTVEGEVKALVPLVVLVNRGSASASEIVAGAIKDTGTGVLVGEKTFGKGLVQKVFLLQGGAALKLTTAKYLTPQKNDINGKGIVPDEVLPMSPEATQKVLLNAPNLQEDIQLLKALEILHQKLGQ